MKSASRDDAIDIYAFSPEVSPRLLDSYRELTGDDRKSSPVRFIAHTTGPYAAFAIIEVRPERDRPPLASFPRLLRAAFKTEGGDPPTNTALKPSSWRHLSDSYPFMAIVGIRVKPGKAGQVLGAVQLVDGYNGGAIVAGNYDVLLEVGAESFDELRHRLLHQLHRVPGIVWSETSIVVDYWYRDEDKFD